MLKDKCIRLFPVALNNDEDAVIFVQPSGVRNFELSFFYCFVKDMPNNIFHLCQCGCGRVCCVPARGSREAVESMVRACTSRSRRDEKAAGSRSTRKANATRHRTCTRGYILRRALAWPALLQWLQWNSDAWAVVDSRAGDRTRKRRRDGLRRRCAAVGCG